MTAVTAAWNRLLAFVGRYSMYRLVLIALGSAGALTWFEPIQPILQAVAVALLGWALFARLGGERFCPLPAPNSASAPVSVRAAGERS